MSTPPNRKRELEIIAVLACYSLFYLLVIGPFLGAVAGFEQAAIQADGYRLTLSEILSPRGILLILSTIAVGAGYAYLRPLLAGTTPQAYWRGE